MPAGGVRERAIEPDIYSVTGIGIDRFHKQVMRFRNKSSGIVGSAGRAPHPDAGVTGGGETRGERPGERLVRKHRVVRRLRRELDRDRLHRGAGDQLAGVRHTLGVDDQGAGFEFAPLVVEPHRAAVAYDERSRVYFGPGGLGQVVEFRRREVDRRAQTGMELRHHR